MIPFRCRRHINGNYLPISKIEISFLWYSSVMNYLLEKNMNNYLSKSFLCNLYIILTVFVGLNVINYLHLNIEGDSVLALSHYLTIPFLLLTYLINFKKISLYKYERYLIIASCVIGMFQKIFMNKSAGMSFFINSVFEPLMLCAVLRLFNSSQLKRLRFYLLSFVCVECIIAIYEYFFGNFLFAISVDSLKMVTGQEEMRAYALHGHPLQNSFLVSMVMCGIITSNLNINFRYVFFFIGYLALFCFNSRSSIYFMGIILLMNLWRDFIVKKQSLWKKICLFLFLGIAIFYLLIFVQTHNMGTRLAIGMNSDDSSSYARFILLNILTNDMSLTDILVGLPSSMSTFYMVKYSLVAIENSVVNLIFAFGIFYTVFFFLYWFKIFKYIGSNKFTLLCLIIIMALLFNTNNALQTFCPIIPMAIMVLYAFKYN